MMKKNNYEKRVNVDLPITVSVDDKKSKRKISSKGRVSDLSINGMKLALPLPFGMVDENSFDIDLDLPNPFTKIKSHGQVKWKTWNEKDKCVECGLELEPMTLQQLADLDCIVDELSRLDK